MKKKKYRNITLYLSIFVFLILLVTSILVGIILTVLHTFGLLVNSNLYAILLLVAFSVIIGTLITLIFSAFIVGPYRKLNEATKEIADGNFNVQVDLKGPYELEQLAENFNLMAKELGSIETMRSDFVSNVSHEFKTPIASIKGFAKLLKKNTLSDESRNEYLDIIIKESDRLTKLTGNILLLSKIERQEIITDHSTFLLDEQLRRAILMTEPNWSVKGLSLVTELPELRYTGSEELLMQVWVNLLGNAIKFSKNGGQISVSLANENNYTIVKISDSGIGMSEEVIKNVFDKFYQGDKSHSMEGNGLGLALVKRIIEMSKGYLTIESEESMGTSVSVYLPVKRT